MGVPKFYRWLSERYPCLSEVINDSQIPEFDNLYLDMNGIIHCCSHPNDDDVTFRISEEQIFADIFKYIDKLYRIIRPKKVFFMAVDGVAPRAKMNQQRARRFMSAKNAEILVQKAIAEGEMLPTEKRFDSNCITPGTHFMVELHRRLAEWVKQKINTDAAWQGIRIFLSGHDCPGEGEHKIMDFIRYERSLPEYDHNTRHCMYGLDADLIMLGMCSHEPHFSLLREEVKFNRPVRPATKNKKAPPPPKKQESTDNTFHLLHLSLLREYLAWEFISVKENLSFEYNMERIIDDWVLMGFLVGNDFIPHLPNVHIHEDALPALYATYVQVLPTLDGYINEDGQLNLARFQIFLKAFASKDKEVFLEQHADDEYMRKKRLPRERVEEPGPLKELVKLCDLDESDTTEDDEGGEGAFITSDEDEENGDVTNRHNDPMEDEFSEQLAMLQFKEMDDSEFKNDVENCWSRTINKDFKMHKKRYYGEKMEMQNISRTQLKEQAEGYVRAIQWNLHYYYHGCCSWNWFFAFHYAPYISDVADFAGMEMNFEKSVPLRPFEQLLAVLPPASAESLPRPLRDLMCNKESMIADFYPEIFGTDLNGKKNDWEAVVLIPFIHEQRLLEAMRSKEHLFSEDEKRRNTHGPHLLFTTLPQPVNGSRAQCTEIDKDLFRIPMNSVVHGLLPDVKLDVFFPGFPTMKHLPHTASLKAINVKVFLMPSRKESMMITIKERPELQKDLREVAREILGKEVCVDWPFLKVAIVEEIWTDAMIIRREEDDVKVEKVNLKEKFDTEMREAKDRLMTRFAINVGNGGSALARVRRLLGTTYEWDGAGMTSRRQWSPLTEALFVPLNLVCLGVILEEGYNFSTLSLSEAFPCNSKVFVMIPNWDGYGYPAFVEGICNEDKPDCGVIVKAAVSPQLNLREMRTNLCNFSLRWMDGNQASRQSGISRALISRLTGTVFLLDGDREDSEKSPTQRPPRINIGLNLKFSKQNMETPDYCRRLGEEGYWTYSLATVRVLCEYKNTRPTLINYLENHNDMNDVYYSSDIWPNVEQRKQMVEGLQEWLNSLPCFNLEKQKVGLEYLDMRALQHLQQIIPASDTRMVIKKSIVKPGALYRPALQQGRSKARPDAEANFLLLDRVTYALQGGVIPFGLQGTVIGIVDAERVEVLFDREFPAGVSIRGSKASASCVALSALINITFAKERKAVKIPPPNTQDAKGRLNSAAVNKQSLQGEQSSPGNSRWKEKMQEQLKTKSSREEKKPMAPMSREAVKTPLEKKKKKEEMTKEAEELLATLFRGEKREAKDKTKKGGKKEAEKKKEKEDAEKKRKVNEKNKKKSERKVTSEEAEVSPHCKCVEVPTTLCGPRPRTPPVSPMSDWLEQLRIEHDKRDKEKKTHAEGNAGSGECKSKTNEEELNQQSTSACTPTVFPTNVPTVSNAVRPTVSNAVRPTVSAAKPPPVTPFCPPTITPMYSSTVTPACAPTLSPDCAPTATPFCAPAVPRPDFSVPPPPFPASSNFHTSGYGAPPSFQQPRTSGPKAELGETSNPGASWGSGRGNFVRGAARGAPGGYSENPRLLSQNRGSRFVPQRIYSDPNNFAPVKVTDLKPASVSKPAKPPSNRGKGTEPSWRRWVMDTSVKTERKGESHQKTEKVKKDADAKSSIEALTAEPKAAACELAAAIDPLCNVDPSASAAPKKTRRPRLAANLRPA